LRSPIHRSIYKERKSLRRSLHDSKTTVSKLNQLLSVVLLFFMLFVYLAIFRVQLEKFLVLYSGIVGAYCCVPPRMVTVSQHWSIS
jgi:hypothetical protein